MTPGFDTLFPDDIPGSCLRASSGFFYRLALVCEQRYGRERRRDSDKRYRETMDPDQPWRRKNDSPIWRRRRVLDEVRYIPRSARDTPYRLTLNSSKRQPQNKPGNTHLFALRQHPVGLSDMATWRHGDQSIVDCRIRVCSLISQSRSSKISSRSKLWIHPKAHFWMQGSTPLRLERPLSGNECGIIKQDARPDYSGAHATRPERFRDGPLRADAGDLHQ